MDTELIIQKELKRKNDNFAVALLERELDTLHKYKNLGLTTIDEAVKCVEDAINMVKTT
jgi:hypothetical protein